MRELSTNEVYSVAGGAAPLVVAWGVVKVAGAVAAAYKGGKEVAKEAVNLADHAGWLD